MIARIFSAGLRSLPVLVTLSLLASAPALAAEDETTHGFYSGATLGWEFHDIGGQVGSDATFDDDGLAWDVLAGYQINRNFGFEGGFMNTADIKGHDNDDTPTKIELGSEGGFAQVVANLPIWCSESVSVSLIGLGGAYFYDVKVRSTTPPGTPKSENDSSGNGVAGIGGVGIQLDVFKHVELRLAYRHFFDVQDSDIDSIGLSVIFTQWQ